MKQLDRYYFFLFKALSEANESPEFRYFYHLKNDCLIVVPVKNAKTFNNGEWVELPKISHQNRLLFLTSFFEKQNKLHQKEIIKLINSFNERSNFDISKLIRKIDYDLALSFEISRGAFLLEQIEALYSKFNLNENIEIKMKC